MRNFISCCFLLLFASVVYAQKDIKPSDAVEITGEVQQKIRLTLADLLSMPSETIGDVVITSHTGEPRGTAKALKGVPLHRALAAVAWQSKSPKDLSELYLVCRATDGYRVVFSWNEMFNHPGGDRVYLITEKEGKPASEMEERILLLAPGDRVTGRRHIKALEQIEVRRAN